MLIRKNGTEKPLIIRLRYEFNPVGCKLNPVGYGIIPLGCEIIPRGCGICCGKNL